MDDLDRKIITLLLDDARMPYAHIAEQLAVATTTVHQRVRRLHERGVIRGTRVALDWEQVGLPVTALVSVEYTGPDSLSTLAGRLAAIPYIQSCYSVTGEFDLMLVIRAHSSDHLGEVLEHVRALVAGRSRTVVVLATHFDQRSAPLEP